MNVLKSKPFLILLLILLVGGIFRFYNLNWDGEFGFHPDERNILYGITRLDIEEGKMNPEFFAYGTFPIYVIYFIGYIATMFTNTPADFETYQFIGRLLSAISSVAIIALVYVLSNELLTIKRKKFFALFAAGIVALLPGMIQFAHFMTFETFLTLQYLLITLMLVKYVSTNRARYLILAWLFFGLSVSTKITSVVIAPALFITMIYVLASFQKTLTDISIRFLRDSIILGLGSILVFIITSPYFLLDLNGFLDSLSYESPVADGSLLVFYTQQFLNTTPVLYQLKHIFPYIMSPPIFLASLFTGTIVTAVLIKVLIRDLKNKTLPSPQTMYISILFIMMGSYLAFNFSLFVKWTRYMIPVLPYLSIMMALACAFMYERWPKAISGVMTALILWGIISSISFSSTYILPDTRVKASNWSKTTMMGKTTSSELYDLGIIPFNPIIGSNHILLLNWYDEDQPHIANKITADLDITQFYIRLSDRVWETRMENGIDHLLAESFLRELNDKSKWNQLVNFDRSHIDCGFWTLNCMGGLFMPDETFSVFDHPSITIYEKVDTP